MNPAIAAQILTFAASLTICSVGAGVALGAGNDVKRVVGLTIAHIGAALACLAVGASSLALPLCASMAATSALGAALAARLKETHGAAEDDAPALDAGAEGGAQ